MSISEAQEVTVIYYDTESIELQHKVIQAELNESGKVIIPETFKENKSIVSVFKGKLNIINKVGERVLPQSYVA